MIDFTGKFYTQILEGKQYIHIQRPGFTWCVLGNNSSRVLSGLQVMEQRVMRP